MSAGAGAQSRPPTPEPNFAGDVTAPRPCAYDTKDPFEKKFYEIEGWTAPDYERYPGACRRMRFSYGPIAVKPGQNDVLLGPVTIEKPDQDGYITRFKPNLVRADGTMPPVEQVHLHHGTWLSTPGLRQRPVLRRGRGEDDRPVAARLRHADQGHRPVAAAATWSTRRSASRWRPTSPTRSTSCPRPRRSGSGSSPHTRSGSTCGPRAIRCSTSSASSAASTASARGRRSSARPSTRSARSSSARASPATAWARTSSCPRRASRFGRVDKFTGGTLIGIGGHLHPGGLTNDIDLVRPGGEDVTRQRDLQGQGVAQAVGCRLAPCVKRKGKRCVKRRGKKRTRDRER